MSEASWADALCKVIAERDALAKQLATAREDALREALASTCGHEEAYRAIEKLVEEKTK